jgi:hypothetical protein
LVSSSLFFQFWSSGFGVQEAKGEGGSLAQGADVTRRSRARPVLVRSAEEHQVCLACAQHGRERDRRWKTGRDVAVTLARRTGDFQVRNQARDAWAGKRGMAKTVASERGEQARRLNGVRGCRLARGDCHRQTRRVHSPKSSPLSRRGCTPRGAGNWCQKPWRASSSAKR